MRARPLWREAAIDIFIETVALTFGALLPIMNPFSTAPLFISLTSGFDSRRRNRQALMACIYAFAILVTFLLLGAAIIDFFGISIPGIRVAGGLIISATGFRMLFPAPKNLGSAQAGAAQQEADVAFTPIAMPSLAGPGSISVVLTAAGHIRSIRPEDWQFVYVAVIAGMVVTLIFSCIVLRASAAMIRFMGPGGIDAMTRIFGFLLICIGIQFLLTGISDYFGLAHA
ncbi:MAG TPA: MarC family NAAT transporter [Allosphingosinicella sp.]